MTNKYTPEELVDIRKQALDRLDAWAKANREDLAAGRVTVKSWEDCPEGKRLKVGKGYLIVRSQPKTTGYPGVCYTSSQGRNSDNSYSGFLPGVNFDEALLLVYDDFLKHTRPRPLN